MFDSITPPRFSRPQFLTWRHMVIVFAMFGTGLVNPTDIQAPEWLMSMCMGAFLAFGVSFLLFALPAFRKEHKLILDDCVDNGYANIAAARQAEDHQRWMDALPFMRGHRGGYVYIIRDIDVTGFYKIGKTNQPSRRLNEFIAQYPFRFVVSHIIVCRDMTAVETLLHRHFANKRARGEWFALDAGDVAWIRQLESA